MLFNNISTKSFPKSSEIQAHLEKPIPPNLNTQEKENIIKVIMAVSQHFGGQSKSKNEIRIESEILLSALTGNSDDLHRIGITFPIEKVTLSAKTKEKIQAALLPALLLISSKDD
ncbi:MAG: hypothetical protein V4489_08885 [Chlamydiota bacterium]